MATRLLLTLLALLTGLAAQLAPAQARGGAHIDVQVGAMASAVEGHRQAVPPVGERDWRSYCDSGDGDGQTWPVMPSSVLTAPVLHGIDRARE